MRRIIVLNRLDEQLFELSEADVFELKRRESINGEHSLSITTTRVLGKGNRVVYADGRGKVREYVITGVDALHSSGKRAVGTYYCTWSMQQDLMGVRVSKQPGLQTPVPAANALRDVLSTTGRWNVGTVTNTSTGGASMYDTDAWSAMKTLVNVWGGEVDTTVTIGSDGILTRLVDLYSRQGEQTAKRRFDFGDDLTSVRRIMDDAPLYCRITPRGKGEQTEGGGYGRKITIAQVNDGDDWLEYEPMVDIAKLPDGNGGWEYPTLEIENSNCATPSELMTWAQSVLVSKLQPKITYEVNVVQAAIEGVDVHGVSLGDAVQVVDAKFDNLRIEGRIVELTVDELNERNVKVVIGSISETLSSKFSNISETIDAVDSRVTDLQNSLSTAEYIDGLIGRLNAEINATGGYTYIVPGHGILTYDVEVSDPLNPTNASRVVEVKGGTIRIANSKTAQGEWEWRTVFVSGHISADLVTAARITTGYIGNAGGTFWDLDNDILQIANTSKVGTRTVADLLATVDSTITDVDTDVEYAKSTSNTDAPTSGWSTTAPAWEQGYYIWQRTKNTVTTAQGDTTTYSDPTCISGRDGSDGVGISVTTISYGTSASASTQPTNWGSSVPTSINQGEWLWTRIVYTYTDNSTETIYSKSYMGSDGTSVTILGSYNTLAELQAAHPTGNLGDGYIVNGDLYVWNGSAWENVGTIQGPQGPAGTSVTVSSVQYGTSASASTSPSSWSTTAPTSITKGQWLWVKTTFSDGHVATSKSYAGTDGAAAVTYNIASSVDAMVRDKSGVVSPSSVTFTATSKTGNGAAAAYAGRFKIQTSENGSTWTDRYTSSSNQSSYTYSGTPSAAKYIRGILYAAGGTTNQLDVQTVAIVSDGANGTNGTNGTNGADAYTVVLSNESHTFPGGTSAAIASSAACSVIAYKGATRIAATIGTITGKPTGMSTSISNNGTTSAAFTVSVTTSMTTRNGTLSIPLTIDGKSFTAVFSYALALKGDRGQTGIGVSDTVEEYYLSTSAVQQVGGSWSTNQPAWESGKYIWTRSKVTWSDSTVTTTSPVLAGALNSANEQAEEAAKIATNYLTYDASTGLDIGYSGTSAKTRINASGMEVFDGSGSSALYAGLSSGNSIVRAGLATDGNIVMSSEGYVDIRNGTTSLAHFGYGEVHDPSSIYPITGPFYTFGTRASNDPSDIGYNSVAMGFHTTASGEDSFATGEYTTASGRWSAAFGRLTDASGQYSAAFGFRTKSAYNSQLVCGEYNNNTSGNYFEVGNGISTSDRRNCFAVSDGTITMFNPYFNGRVNSYGPFNNVSDSRLKDHVGTLGDDACEFVRRLNPIRYRMKGRDEERLGFYAQEVRDADLWDTATVSSDLYDESLGFAPLTLDYTALIAPLVAYTQSLEKRIEQLESRLNALEGDSK